jgi:hypothetical protein
MNPTWLYVGALYAAAVALARRAGVELPKRIALLFYLLVLVFFFKPMTQRYVNIPVDMMTVLPPWSLVTTPHFLNPEMNDVAYQHAPWAHLARESLRAGRAPLWNESTGSGYPLLANGQSSALSPIRILALPLNLGHAMTAEAAIKILIALTFTFLYCRGRRWSDLASTIGAVTFGFGGFMTVWLHFPHITTACFLPAVLYFIDRLADNIEFGAFVAAAVVWASLLYGGHPETASHIFVLSLLYVLWIVFVERSASWRLLVTLGGALCVAALLAAPFLAPFAEAVTKSERYHLLKLHPWSAATLPYKTMESALVQMQPHFFGRVPMEDKWGPSDPDPIAGYAGVLGFAAWVALVISVTTRRAWRSREMFFVAASLFVVGVTYGFPGLSEGMHRVLPLVAHHRFRLLLNMLLAIQAACVVDRLQRGEERKPMLIGIAVVAATLILPFAITEFPTHARFTGALEAIIPSFVVLGLALGRRHATFVLLLAAVVFEIWSVTYVWSPPLPESMMYPRTPFIDALERLKTREKEPFRIAGWYATFFPNASAVYGFQDIRVHDPMASAKYLAYLEGAAGYKAWDYFAHWTSLDAPVLDYLNVRYMLVDDWKVPVDPQRYALVYSGVDGRIFRNRQCLPRFFPVRNVILEFRRAVFDENLKNHRDWANTALLDNLRLETPQMRDDFFRPRPANALLATSKILQANNADYRIAVRAPRWTLVVSSIPWWPGWKVERNGKRITPIRVNGLFLGFAVPPGENEVHVWYAPWTFWAGVWAAAGTAVLLLVAGSWLSAGSRAKPQATRNQ